MSPQDFAFWLQGFVEMNGGKQPTPEQWKMITEHLALVFKKETPKLGEPFTPDWNIPTPFIPGLPATPYINPHWTYPAIPGHPIITC